jgi:hypothetical protein
MSLRVDFILLVTAGLCYELINVALELGWL